MVQVIGEIERPVKTTFTAKLVAQGPGGAWTRLDLPFDVEMTFGQRGRVSVKGTINGFSFRTSIFSNGKGRHHMMVNKAMQHGAKAGPGATVRVTLEVDTDAKSVEIPAEIQRALGKNKAARAAFDKLAPSHRREYIRHYGEAKKPETRQRRVEQMIQRLLANGAPKRR